MNRQTNRRRMGPYPEFEDEFHRLLGRLVHAFARFDFNVGLRVRSLGCYHQKDVSEVLNPLAPFCKRLRKLRQLVLDAFEPAGERAIAEFRDWFERADKARGIRNDYVHGRWGVPGDYRQAPSGRQVDAEPLLTFVPLDWELIGDQEDRTVSMTITEFAEQVEEVESLLDYYHRLEERYLKDARVGKPGRPS